VSEKEQKEILAILPKSIGGRLTVSSIIDGFKKNGFEVFILDELNSMDFDKSKDYTYLLGYDFSPVKFKIENNLKIKTICYFSDVIQKKTSGEGFDKYYNNLFDPDITVFYLDRALSKKEGWNYLSHFVNCDIYKNYFEPTSDIGFMGRLDTDLRLKTYLELNKNCPELKFKWYAIKRHYEDAVSRCKDDLEREIIENTYSGFIDNEIDMARAINKVKIIYNINAQGVSSLNYRTFQAMACQRLLISDEREELDIFDNILPTYKDIDDLIYKIKYYLEDEEEYKYITKKSRNFIKQNHDSVLCTKKMIDVIENKILV